MNLGSNLFRSLFCVNFSRVLRAVLVQDVVEYDDLGRGQKADLATKCASSTTVVSCLSKENAAEGNFGKYVFVLESLGSFRQAVKNHRRR
jgi:hypothetical protein